MHRNRILLATIPLLAVAGLWVYRSADGSEGPAYRFATVERGDIEATVSATGTLGAVTTVQVGTQVSGQISAIFVDFNDRVKKGQLIARIDPTLQQQAVRDAQAGVERNRAELDQAERDHERNQQLFDRKVITESEFNAVQYQLAVARANTKSAQVTLDRARQNLAYTSIYAPIDGIVVERNVDVGQTVAASLSAPQLFLIANDLSRMQILASVDESDIGIIEEGQAVRFSVQAHQNETFTGTVKQVRLQSTTQENVVNYTVVVEVENPDGKLLPGMTATVDFLTGSATDVLMLPNAALRFRATEAMTAALRPAQGAPARSAEPAGSDSMRTRRGAAAGQGESARGAARPRNVAVLWYVDEDGALATARVRTGMTDGQKTEIQGRDLAEGMRVIIGVSAESGAAASSAASPFQTQQQSGPPRPGGF
jgi:HlyD family secretion protein